MSRVCMLVYNNCTRDARVVKEAGSLVRAGHEVCIVAVLDSTTEPDEVRDGIRIVRIDRDPPHYRLLRATRRTRRRVRLLPGRVRAAPRRVLRFAVARSTHASRASRSANPFVRVYLAVRWRVLRASPRLARLHYERRARGPSRRAVRAYRRRAAIARERRELLLEELLARSPVTGAAAPAPALPPARPAPPPTPSSGLLARVDRRVSASAYRAVMLPHKPLLYFDWYRRAYRFARTERFDVVHAHDLNTLPVAAALARTGRRRLVYDAHELYTEVSTLSAHERRIWRAIERRLIGRADHVFTVCESIAAELSRRYGIGAPTVLLNCPPAAARVVADREHPLRAHAGLDASAEPIVLYQGGFAVHRGLPELLDAAGRLHRGVVVLMGWGVLEHRLGEMVQERDLGDRVRIVPPVAPAEVQRYAAGATVGVIPYQPVGLNNYYTTPNKLFDYMSAGLAIAGSRLPELERFVDGLGVGVTFRPGDPDDLARALNGLLADPARLAAMQARSLQVRDRFTWETVESALIEAYAGFAPAGAIAGVRPGGASSPAGRAPAARGRRPGRGRPGDGR
jgi:glycosyltransferase involved in cell wall biosynthesis